MNRHSNIFSFGERILQPHGHMNLGQSQLSSNPDSINLHHHWVLHAPNLDPESAHNRHASSRRSTTLSPSFSAPPTPSYHSSPPANQLAPHLPLRVLIPQRTYQSRPGVQYCPPSDAQYIPFTMEDGSGLWMKNALRQIYTGLRERDNRTLFGSNLPSSGTISIRIEWYGYQPYSKQIRVYDGCHTKRQICLGRLGTTIAKVLESFIAEMQYVIPNTDEPGCLEVGPVGSVKINLDNICLLGLRNVSEGSWQPEFALFQ